MAAGPADVIVAGGAIHSVDNACASPQAFAIKDGRFVHVGSLAGAIALRGPRTEIVDVTGYTVLPGIVDAHLHLTSLGLTLEQADLRDARSFEELVARTAAFAQTAPDEWILGRGWDQNRWHGGEFPRHDELSAAFEDRPVALTRVDGHALLANARAMAIAGVDEATPDPPGGRILRDSRGKPTGIFVDSAEALINDRIPEPDHARLARAVGSAIAECNRWGVTTVAEPGCDEAALAAQTNLLERNEYTLRNYAMLESEASLIAAHARAGPTDASYEGRLWIRAIKVYADGALGSRGAALLEPYSDDPSNEGLILTPQLRIQALTEEGLRSGFQLCVHAIGDRANRMVLDAYETALQHVRPRGDPRLRVEHAQVIAPEDLPRFARLGIIASVQASHALSDMGWAAARLGPRRIEGAFALRSLLDSGARIANGTDAPVEPVSPARTFAASVGQPGRRPDACLTRGEALASMTAWAAHANFQENLIGSISVGKYADFVVLDRDWMRVPIETIAATRIVATYFAGRCVHGGIP